MTDRSAEEAPSDHERWGKNYCGTTAWPEGEPLASEQVAALEDGAPVVIRWGGGNGPHRYTVTVIRDTLYVRSTHEDEAWFRENAHKYADPLWPTVMTHYGPERWQTKVWRDDVGCPEISLRAASDGHVHQCRKREWHGSSAHECRCDHTWPNPFENSLL